MPSCVIKGCTNHSRKLKKSDGVTFHRFLRHGHEEREAWIQFVQKSRNEETWLPTDHTYLCSLHFKDKDKYSTKTGRTYLKKSAVPFDYKSVSGIDKSQAQVSEIDKSQGSQAPGSSGLSVDPLSEYVSDESILDTPREIVLKNTISRETTARKNLYKQFRKVKRQNRYLKQKCESYKNILNKLKEKFGFNLRTEMHLMAKEETEEIGSDDTSS